MSALAIILAAAMVVPGNGPEMVSGEVVRELEPLDLSGEWEGTRQISGGGVDRIALSNGEMSFWRFALPIPFQIESQKGNLLRIRWRGRSYLGIYEQKNDRVRICLNVAEDGQPPVFELGDKRVILTLRRVKPCK